MRVPRTREDALGAVEAELRAERASSLGRVGKELDAHLERLRALTAEFDAAPFSQRADVARRHAEVRKQAEETAWKLVVQREAMGLFHHAVVAERYPIPPALKA